MRIVLVPIAAAVSLAGCATSAEPDLGERPVREPAGECDAEPVQYHLGHTASADMGAAMLAESGARQLRWAPPRSAMTMDYRPDRLTVEYNDDMIIERIACG